MNDTSGTIFWVFPRCVVHPKISHNFRLQKLLCPRCVVQKNYCPRCHAGKKEMSQMCCSTILNDANVPDVMFRTFPKEPLSQMCAPKTPLSQMSCSEHFQKNHCPRCVLQKNLLSQMCGSKKNAVPDVCSKNAIVPDVMF